MGHTVTQLPDIQNERGDYKYALNAGVSNILRPITIRRRPGDGGDFVTVARLSATVKLERSWRGVNMSRLCSILHELQSTDWVANLMEPTLKILTNRCDSSGGQLIYKFPFFYDKSAPVSGYIGTASADITLRASLDNYDATPIFRRWLVVDTPVITLCPCSKAMSEKNAHNQRARVIVAIEMGEPLTWFEDIIEISESCASACPYPVLKRADEKRVTDWMYENPTFVEDVARNVVRHIDNVLFRAQVASFRVVVKSEESIHQHDAIASYCSENWKEDWPCLYV